MFENLEVFRMSHAMAVHAGQKQAVAAENVANADTPDYKARDIAPFEDVFSPSGGAEAPHHQRATRSSHLNGTQFDRSVDPFIDKNGVEAPNGNTVSLETEMLKSLDAKRQHDRALAIYRSSLTILRTALART